jgi:hypothetical protein
MICVVHGGQTGVDRGAHEAAVVNDWPISGYMPRRRCDELGPIPEDVARYLVPYETGGYGERTEANVRSSDAILVVVPLAQDSAHTPGTALTIAIAREQHRLLKIVDPHTSRVEISAWISSACRELAEAAQAQRSLFGSRDPEPVFLRLMVAGPRESRWPGAREATMQLLRDVDLQLRSLDASSRRIA